MFKTQLQVMVLAPALLPCCPQHTGSTCCPEPLRSTEACHGPDRLPRSTEACHCPDRLPQSTEACHSPDRLPEVDSRPATVLTGFLVSCISLPTHHIPAVPSLLGSLTHTPAWIMPCSLSYPVPTSQTLFGIGTTCSVHFLPWITPVQLSVPALGFPLPPHG